MPLEAEGPATDPGPAALVSPFWGPSHLSQEHKLGAFLSPPLA